MLAAVSDFVYLTGWMAMYEMKQGLGQRITCARSISRRGARTTSPTARRTLRGMSLQASHLGYGPKALELADAAAEAAPASGPRLVAFLRGQQAAAAAMTGDRNTAVTRLRQTEAALAQADNRRDAVGGVVDEAAFHFQLQAACSRPATLKATGRAAAEGPGRPQRGPAGAASKRSGAAHRAFGAIAQRQMAMRHVEAACATWNEFLDEHQMISSARGDEHLRKLRTGLKPYASLPVVRSVAERAREVADLKAA